MDLQAGPTSDGTVAVVRGTPGYSPEEQGGVLIYDDGTARPDELCGWTPQPGCTTYPSGLYDSIQWNSNGTEMFAANNEDTGFDFYTVPVTSAGFGSQTDYPGLISNFGDEIHYDATTNDIYEDTGAIIDPTSGAIVGTFDASGLMVPDGSLGTAFFLGQLNGDAGSSTYTLESFDIQHFTPIATMTINNVVGTPTHLIHWGSDGLAFTTSNFTGSSSAAAGAVYLISGPFVSGSSSKTGSVPLENVRRTWKIPKLTISTPAPSQVTHSF
jgi:hypothetical protein